MYRIQYTGYSVPTDLASKVDGDTIDDLEYLYRNTRFEDFINRIKKEGRVLFIQEYLCYADYPEEYHNPLLKNSLDRLGIEYRLEEFDE